jgi:hypothetical protein
VGFKMLDRGIPLACYSCLSRQSPSALFIVGVFNCLMQVDNTWQYLPFWESPLAIKCDPGI